MYQVLENIPLPSNKISGSTEDPTATPQDTSTVIYSVAEKSAPILEKPVAASLEEPAPIYHVPDKPNPIQEVSSVPSNRISIDPGAPPIPPFCLQDPIHVPEKPVVPSNRISTDAGAPPIPPFCVGNESATEISSLGTLL